MHQERVRNNFHNWHLKMTAIFKRFSFRNARNTIKHSFTFLQSERLNLVALLGTSCKNYFVLVPRFTLLALTVFLSGCSFSPVKVAPESSYTITQWPQDNVVQGQSKSSKTILITTPVASPGYESSNMVYVMVPYQLRSFANHHWVSSPAQLLLPLLANHVRATGYFKGVVSSPFSGGTSYQLNTQLLVLQQEFLRPQSVVRLTMQATLLNGMTGKMIASRVFEAVIPAKNNNPYGGVLATNKAANQVLAKIASWTVAKVTYCCTAPKINSTRN